MTAAVAVARGWWWGLVGARGGRGTGQSGQATLGTVAASEDEKHFSGHAPHCQTME